jgi:hypothetical protein
LSPQPQLHQQPESKPSHDSLDFYDIMGETFHDSTDVQYYFNHDIQNINPDNKKIWRLRYHVLKQYGF